jgi:flavorubredoxin
MKVGANMILHSIDTEAQPVTEDTFLIPTLFASPGGGFVGVHSMVIRGAQPAIIDTGAALVRDTWLDKVRSVVDPQEVRWIVLSHDDHDHLGNLDVMLELCPNATLVASYSITGRLAADIELPIERMRWLDVGESLDLGDRTLHAVRPPMFDSPATRGFYDSSSRVLWAADSFGALVDGDVHEAADVPADLWTESFAMMNSWNTPWMEWLDRDRFAAHVQTTATLPLAAIASAHGPILRGRQIETAFDRTLDLAAQPALPMPGSELLDAIVSGALALAS